MSVQVGDIVLVREDRHTNRETYEAHLAAVAAVDAYPALLAEYEAATARGEKAEKPEPPPAPPPENPAPPHAWYWPLIVETVHASGAVSGTVFRGRRGSGHIRKVQPGDTDGCFIPKAAA